MPITRHEFSDNSVSHTDPRLTVVYGFEFTDYVQANFGEVILEEMQEQGKEVFDRGFLPKERSHTTDLLCQSGSNVLGSVLRKISHTGYDTSKDDFLLELA